MIRGRRLTRRPGLSCRRCQKDANEGNFTAGIIHTLREMGASGRVYMWGGSNGANAIQILAANAGPTMPITAISAGWGQLMAEPPRSGPSPFNWNQPTLTPDQKLPGRVGDGRKVAQQAHHGDHDTTIPYQGGHNGCTRPLTNPLAAHERCLRQGRAKPPSSGSGRAAPRPPRWSTGRLLARRTVVHIRVSKDDEFCIKNEEFCI